MIIYRYRLIDIQKDRHMARKTVLTFVFTFTFPFMNGGHVVVKKFVYFSNASLG